LTDLDAWLDLHRVEAFCSASARRAYRRAA
jgi:hypothetical protein